MTLEKVTALTKLFTAKLIESTHIESADDENLEAYKSSPLSSLTSDEASALETEIKFEGYLQRQEDEIKRVKKSESMLIPNDICYDSISSLRTEFRQKLKLHKPFSIGQAMRIPGITPSAISVLSIYLESKRG